MRAIVPRQHNDVVIGIDIHDGREPVAVIVILRAINHREAICQPSTRPVPYRRGGLRRVKAHTSPAFLGPREGREGHTKRRLGIARPVVRLDECIVTRDSVQLAANFRVACHIAVENAPRHETRDRLRGPSAPNIQRLRQALIQRETEIYLRERHVGVVVPHETTVP